jgi:hypothetical protein
MQSAGSEPKFRREREYSLLCTLPASCWFLVSFTVQRNFPTKRRFTFTGLHAAVGVLINLWLFLFLIFLFAAQPKGFFMDGLKKLEQRSHKCVELRGEYVQ